MKLFLAVLCAGLLCVIVVFLDHTHLLFKAPEGFSPYTLSTEVCTCHVLRRLNVFENVTYMDEMVPNASRSHVIRSIGFDLICYHFYNAHYNYYYYYFLYRIVMHTSRQINLRRM